MNSKSGQTVYVVSSHAIRLLLWVYLAIVVAFIFLPIVASVVFSFNSQRFPTIPLGSFSLQWYRAVISDPEVWSALRTSVLVSVCTAVLSTLIGFCTAYTDYRFNFRFKSVYLGLALLPPTVPLIILALAMLAWFARLGIAGYVGSIVIAHTVLCAPFAMAVIRLRLSQMDSNLEAAAWNLGGSPWAAMREVVIPFCRPAIVSAFCLTAAVSFDEFAVAWFVSGLNKTVPVFILEIVQGNIDPRVNAIGSFVFLTSMTLIVVAQVLIMTKRGR